MIISQKNATTYNASRDLEDFEGGGARLLHILFIRSWDTNVRVRPMAGVYRKTQASKGLAVSDADEWILFEFI